MKKRLADFWFEPAPAARLAILRLIIGAFAVNLFLGNRIKLLAPMRFPESMFEPVGVIRLLSGPMPAQLLPPLVTIATIFAVAFWLGLFFRFTGPVFAALLWWILTYRNSWSMIFHYENVLVLHVLVLALAPSADDFSVDALRRRARGGNAECYGWPIKLMNLITVGTYAFAGFAKLTGPTWKEWPTGEVVRAWIAHDQLRKTVLGSHSSDVIVAIYDQKWMFFVFAVGTLILECGAPIALVNRRISRVWAAGAFLMHWCIYFIMAIIFPYHMFGFIFVPFFRVEKILEWRPLRWIVGPQNQVSD
ncbi:MAG: hypothetical protein M5R36_02000 [Deltaproteobacteria bacterium]|nr:hypothetical protein [Deltaproteobacteria bacterium]